MGLFISYSSQDKGAIEPLRNALRRAHQQVWMDEELGGGEAWWRTILEQIRSCEVFIVAMSNNSIASKPCQAELRYAQALHRPIVPVQIGPVTNLRVTPLAETQIIDFRNPTADAGIQLIGAVQIQRAQLQPLPSDLPDEPPVPFAYLMRLAHNIAEPQLSARQQADLVSELKSGLEEDGDDPAARSDIKQLLCMLRDRPDVAWRVRTDIETLLASVDAESLTVNAGVVTPRTTRTSRADRADWPRPRRLTSRGRLLAPRRSTTRRCTPRPLPRHRAPARSDSLDRHRSVPTAARTPTAVGVSLAGPARNGSLPAAWPGRS